MMYSKKKGLHLESVFDYSYFCLKIMVSFKKRIHLELHTAHGPVVGPRCSKKKAFSWNQPLIFTQFMPKIKVISEKKGLHFESDTNFSNSAENQDDL